MFGCSRLSASSDTKNDHSIALSCPQNRTARRVGSKIRLRFGKLSIGPGACSLDVGNPAFPQAFGVPRPPIISFRVASGYPEGLQVAPDRSHGLVARGVSVTPLRRQG